MVLTDRERRIGVAEALRELLAVVNSQRPLEDILDYVLERAIELLDSDAGLVYMVGPDQTDGFLHVGAARGLSPDRVARRVRIGSPVSGLAVQRRRPVAFLDLTQVLADEIGATAEPIIEDWGSHLVVRRIGNLLSEPIAVESLTRLSLTHPAALAVPLVARGEIYGALSLFYSRRREFTDQDVHLASAFGEQAALVIENTGLRDASERRLAELGALAAENERLHLQSEQRAGELEALYRADEQIYRSLHLDGVLNALVSVAEDILRPDKVAVGIWDATNQRIVVGAARGFSATTIAEAVPADDARILRDQLGTGVVVMEDVTNDSRLPPSIRVANEREGVRSSMTAPIHIGDDVVGAFGLSYCQPRTFGEGERRLLLALAQRAGLAIQNARLYEQAQHVATLEERQRLARELHDAVTQTLFSASLIADILPRIWERSPSDGVRHLEELRRLTRGALAEMRGLLVELRPSGLTEQKLADLLVQLGEASMGRLGVDVSVTVKGAPDAPLPPEVQVGLYRIVQEALNNVRKHAEARCAFVTLRTAASGAIALEVRDDGRGFDPRLITGGHFGLGIMRERAQAIGARLRIRSQPGAGTRVRVHWKAPYAIPAISPARDVS